MASGLLARTVAVAFLLTLLPMASGALAADGGARAGKYREYRQPAGMDLHAHPLCPVTGAQRHQRALGNDRAPNISWADAADRDCRRAIVMRVARVVRAAELGDPDAGDIAGPVRNGASIKVDETRIAAALKPDADAGNVERMRARAELIRGRGVKRIRCWASAC